MDRKSSSTVLSEIIKVSPKIKPWAFFLDIKIGERAVSDWKKVLSRHPIMTQFLLDNELDIVLGVTKRDRRENSLIVVVPAYLISGMEIGRDSEDRPIYGIKGTKSYKAYPMRHITKRAYTEEYTTVWGQIGRINVEGVGCLPPTTEAGDGLFDSPKQEG